MNPLFKSEQNDEEPRYENHSDHTEAVSNALSHGNQTGVPEIYRCLWRGEGGGRGQGTGKQSDDHGKEAILSLNGGTVNQDLAAQERHDYHNEKNGNITDRTQTVKRCYLGSSLSSLGIVGQELRRHGLGFNACLCNFIFEFRYMTKGEFANRYVL